MLKRTVYISNPAYLNYKNCQMVIQLKRDDSPKTIPVEDIGFVVIENPQTTFTLPLLTALNANNAAVIFCDSKHMPASMLLNLEGNHVQTELFRHQIDASAPLKKSFWKQVVTAKIGNQAALLEKLGKPAKKMAGYVKTVKSGDTDNREGVAARLYWRNLFGPDFLRDRFSSSPNSLLNYGYMVLRAAVARALTGSGLLPTLGIHHHNKYNAFCLADDIMEPYRPFVDEIVYDIYKQDRNNPELSKEHKAGLLAVLTVDVKMGKETRPLMIALSQTTASLSRCFAGEQRKMIFPMLQ